MEIEQKSTVSIVAHVTTRATLTLLTSLDLRRGHVHNLLNCVLLHTLNTRRKRTNDFQE